MVIILDITVAIASTLIPMAGIGPKSKMSTGSKMILTRAATVIITAGVLVSPKARIAELPIMGNVICISRGVTGVISRATIITGRPVVFRL